MSKGMDQLSRRLHHLIAPGQNPGALPLLGVSALASRYRQINTLSAADAAYIAGLINGEGTVTLTRKHANEHRQAAVTISSTERQLLEFALEKCGVGKITNKCRSHANHLPSFTYAVYNRQALGLLEQVQPYLLSYKRQRSALLLSHYLRLTPRNGKYTKQLLTERRAFEDQLLNIRVQEGKHC